MIIIKNNKIYVDSLNKNLNRVKSISISKNSSEITFLIDKQGNILYDNQNLFCGHDNLITQNKVNELNVCRLIYDPDNLDSSFCGIPGIFASMNTTYNNLPFELKSTHLNAIENFIQEYDIIMKAIKGVNNW